MTLPIDIAFEEHEFLVRLKPLTSKACMWFDIHVRVEDPSLTIGGWTPTDKVFAQPLLQDAVADGLCVAPFSCFFLRFAWDASTSGAMSVSS